MGISQLTWNVVCRYVSLYPLLMRLLAPDSPHLGTQLRSLKDPNSLWTDYGLRSLAKSSSLYSTYNTQHDPPYWRSPIWVNINYLTLAALKHYAQVCPAQSAGIK